MKIAGLAGNNGFIAQRLSQTTRAAPWVVVFTASLFFFYEFIQMNMFDAINTSIMSAFNISAAKMGSLSAGFFYADMAFLFPAGIMLDRMSTRKIILTTMGLSVLGTFIFGIAQTYAVASLAHFVVGIGNAFGFLSCLILASRWFPPRRMALVTGLIVTFAMVGGMVAHTPMSMITASLGWREAVMLNGFLGAALLLLMWLFVYDTPEGMENSDKETKEIPISFWKSLRMAIVNPQTWGAGLYTAFTNLPLMVLGGLWGGLYLQQVHHFSPTEATTISSMLFLGTIFGSPIFGAYSDGKGNRKRPMLVGALLALACVFYMIYGSYENFLTAATLFFLIGFFTSSQIIGYPVISESNSSKITGTALGLGSCLIMLSAGIFQQKYGHILDLNWDGTLLNNVRIYSDASYQKAMMIFPVTLIVCLIITLLLRETHGKPLESQTEGNV